MKEIIIEKPNKYTDLGISISMKWFSLIRDFGDRFKPIAEIVTLKEKDEKDSPETLCIKIENEYFVPVGFKWAKLDDPDNLLGIEDHDHCHSDRVNRVLEDYQGLQANQIDYEMNYEGYTLKIQDEDDDFFASPYLKKEVDQPLEKTHKSKQNLTLSILERIKSGELYYPDWFELQCVSCLLDVPWKELDLDTGHCIECTTIY